MLRYPPTKGIDRSNLSLEEKMFVMGSLVEPLPEGPEPINRTYYNLGLELFRILNYFSMEKRKQLRKEVNLFREGIKDAKERPNDDCDFRGSFPTKKEGVRRDYEIGFLEDEKETESLYQRLGEIKDKISQDCPNLSSILQVQYQVSTIMYKAVKELFKEIHKLIKESGL
ncbi:hypothetical protein KY343_05305 [Candidatus Woesearchaeota archaeon]|nr:hypothetical protein [Candidatus Woesearchaeota archaeon]